AQHSSGLHAPRRIARPASLTEAWTSVTRRRDAFPSSVSRNETRRREPGASLELLGFGRAVERGGGCLAVADHARQLVEPAGSDEGLVLHGAVAVGPLGLELAVLKPGVGGHAALAVLARQLEHDAVERVEAGRGHALEGVAHLAERILEARDGRRVERPGPVERGRAVVGEKLV